MSSNITKAASGDDERQKWTGKLYSANYKAIQKASQDLPVVQHMDAVMKKLDEFPVLVLVAEPGSGKTTQLPKEIALRLDLIVAVTQNRRLATSMVRGILFCSQWLIANLYGTRWVVAAQKSWMLSSENMSA